MKNYNKNKKTVQEKANLKAFDIAEEFTRVPNFIINEVFPKLTPQSAILLNFIMHKTVGWDKTSDEISYSQMRKALGTSCQDTVANCLRELQGIQLYKSEKHQVGLAFIKLERVEGSHDTNTCSINTEITREMAGTIKKHNGVVSKFKADKNGIIGVEFGLPFNEKDGSNSDKGTGKIDPKGSPNLPPRVVRNSPLEAEKDGSNSDTHKTLLLDSTKDIDKNFLKDSTENEVISSGTSNEVEVWHDNVSKRYNFDAEVNEFDFGNYKMKFLNKLFNDFEGIEMDADEISKELSDREEKLDAIEDEVLMQVNSYKADCKSQRKAAYIRQYERYTQQFKDRGKFEEELAKNLMGVFPDHKPMWFIEQIMVMRQKALASEW